MSSGFPQPDPPPTFSVVVPAFNAERTIRATLQSVLDQTRSDFEVIVVDDGSTDRTTGRVMELAGDGRVRLVQQANAGVAAARNAGIGVARGRYVSFLDSDDLWLPRYLEMMGGALDARPDAALAFTDAWVWDENEGRFGRQTIMVTGNPPAVVPDDPQDLFRALLAGNFVYTSATVRRGVLADVGGFNGVVSPAEDWELWLRIVARGHRAIRSAPVLGVHRVRAGSLSSDRAVMETAARRLFDVLADEYGLDDELHRLVRERALAFDVAPNPSRGGAGTAPLARLARPVARLRSHRLRPPRGVTPSVLRLLREST